MRIALLSDVHGNLVGLRAVAAALERDGPLDRVVVAGDHLLGGPRPRETWQTLLATGWTLLRGNEDERLVAEHADDVPNPGDPHYRRALSASHAWARAAVDPAILRALAALPPAYRLTTPAGDLLVVHATPHSCHDRAGTPATSLADLATMYRGTGAAAIAFGHYHQSFVRPTSFALLVNVASVGLPKDQQPLAAYTILTAGADGWVVEQRRVPYDAAEEAAAAEAAGLPAWTPDPLL